MEVRSEGRRRLYRLNGPALEPIHDWVKAYEATWEEQGRDAIIASGMEAGMQDAFELLEEVAISLA